MTVTNPDTVSTAIQNVMIERRIPCATYRLQMNADFTFRAALDVSYYLQELGITDLYLSPIFKARSGSTHGYDICDYSQLNPAIGSEADFDALALSLRERGMSLMLDMVPNHMGVGDPCNLWWMDVLENGPSSIYARFFDIDWHPVKPELANKVVLPILGDQFGAALESGELRLTCEEGAFVITYYETRLPVNPSSYASILNYRLSELQEKLGEDHADILELQSIITAANYLPLYTDTDPEKIAERNREKEVIKRRIATLYIASPEIRTMLDDTLEVFNGIVGEPHSFDLLETVLNEQPYRPAFWRVAADEINYRRFFDINDMAAIRVELPEVFQAVHSLIYKLVSEGKVSSLRIDHPDGLWNPPDYFRRLQENYLLCRVESDLDSISDQTDLETSLHEWFDHTFEPNSPANTNWPFYVVVEKILSETEPLPMDWAVYGTTGYDFLNSVNGLFVNSANQVTFQDIYQRFIGAPMDFERLVESTKQHIMGEALASEVRSLSHQLERITEASRRYRDFTLGGITDAIRDTIASMSIYRTYISDPQNISVRDQYYIGQAIDTARRRYPQTARLVFRFLRDTLLLQNLANFSLDAQPLVVAFVMRLQQITGPVMAKSVEDTAFYVYNRLVSLNEVGGHPEQFGHSTEVFHQHNQDRSRRWPNAMLSTSTHDTKRSEDVRARIDVLSEMPANWEAAIYRWNAQNSPFQSVLDEVPVPDHNDEYLFYQTLIGVWPFEISGENEWDTLRERVAAYMLKAANEAKVHTSWINPNEEYSAALQNFARSALNPESNRAFLDDFTTFQRRVAFYGQFNSLSQTLLKLTSPGMPDIYQGTELWDFSLVDPDNRRPVDYGLRRALLNDLKASIAQGGEDRTALVDDLLQNSQDGRIKLYLTHLALAFRQKNETLFNSDSYIPLNTTGSKQQHVCAFARSDGDQTIIIAVPRLIVGLTDGIERAPLGGDVWTDTRLNVPRALAGATYQNVFTGETLSPDKNFGFWMHSVLARFPVALLERVSP